MSLSSIRTLLVLPLFIPALLCGCGSEDPDRLATFPVTGEVFVDGQPAAEVKVVLTNVAGIDKQNPTESSTFTKEDGKFEVSTYEQGDGVPAGEYVVTFMWGKLNPMSMQYGGPDKLKNKYLDPASSPFKVTVKDGEPADMGRIDLSAK